MFKSILKHVTTRTRVSNVNTRVHAFYMRVAYIDSRVQYATCLNRQSRVLREGQKAKNSQKNLNFYMELLNQITCFAR